MKKAGRGPKFKVGQVVRVNVDSYDKAIRYQKIMRVWPWIVSRKGGYGEVVYTDRCQGYGCAFANKDECHEKYLKPLTKREEGGTGR